MNHESRNYDLAVIGGGINGAGIAADAASRGLHVLLCERDDLACATSSASTKLIHGGLRYLESLEIRLVRKALKESQLLLGLAPHLIQPITIQLPYMQHLRPWLMIRAGLFLYNRLARRPGFPPARALRFGSDSPLVESLRRGFSFSDGQVDDARLVILTARLAADLGATVLTRHDCRDLVPRDGMWQLTLATPETGSTSQVQARVVVNATGPWVSSMVTRAPGVSPRMQVRLVKGSHLVVRGQADPGAAYMLQNEDGRIVFAIPYLDRYTLLGTTEEDYRGDPGKAEISSAETDYLIDVYNRYFRRSIGTADIVHSYAGVRPLIDQGQGSATRASRDYRLEFERAPLPLLSVYGGKVTTYRLLAEQAVDRLAPYFSNLGRSRTRHLVIPGGDFSSRADLSARLARDYPWLPAQTLQRWVGSYGTLACQILAGVECSAQLGVHFGAGLYGREVDYLRDCEWARTVDDILWRRTKLGLVLGAAQRQALGAYLAGRPG